jgi:type VI protein secretion system component Hcp
MIGETDKGQTAKWFYIFSLQTTGATAPPKGTGADSKGSSSKETITVSKNVDASSPALLQAALEGKIYKTVLINIYSANSTVTGTRYTLSNAIITSDKVSGGVSGGAATESVTLEFQKLATEAIKKDGTSISDWTPLTGPVTKF